jgi:hypothetical protein
MPWPDVKGKRCLDVWTFDGSLRFEMAGHRVTNLDGDPGYRSASKGAGFGLAVRDSAAARQALVEQLIDLTTRRLATCARMDHRTPWSAQQCGAQHLWLGQ